QLALFELDISPDVRVGSLSAGQRQLLEVAKALVSNPRFVVLDEPTATLNAVEKKRLFTVLKKLKAQGMAFGLVTHHVDDVLEIGDCVTLLKNGEVVDSFDMTPEVSQADLLEKLCGKRSIARAAQPQSTTPSQDEPLLHLDGLQDNDGNPYPIDIPKRKSVALLGVFGSSNAEVARSVGGLGPAPGLANRLQAGAHNPRAPRRAVYQGHA